MVIRRFTALTGKTDIGTPSPPITTTTTTIFHGNREAKNNKANGAVKERALRSK